MFLSLLAAAHPIVHLNAALNATATVLLCLGLWLIKRGKEDAHRRAMLSAFAVSAVFLVCYLYYHFLVGSVRFTHEGPVRYVYLTILLTHVVLAMAVPFLTIASIYLGYRAQGCCGPADAETVARFRQKHRAVVRWAFPIWLYVSVTGVVVYAMLYHLWPSAEI
ncbi:hypothetical protein Mal64_28140 [Pseudobythopirellula maris]|uniref:DUF420 domain-containing protein n=1 Tax=Pseudobythopirellula maris TaxID=2527991 RepID=A0A5C5ZJ51_9BACT|nr:DUF420 domain-containing protein [Pseudobythopirellula maris]TWT87276.1 hypothetical protein Mal64_28140 [Pseudobythopirellula maris]